MKIGDYIMYFSRSSGGNVSLSKRLLCKTAFREDSGASPQTPPHVEKFEKEGKDSADALKRVGEQQQ